MLQSDKLTKKGLQLLTPFWLQALEMAGALYINTLSRLGDKGSVIGVGDTKLKSIKHTKV